MPSQSSGLLEKLRRAGDGRALHVALALRLGCWATMCPHRRHYFNRSEKLSELIHSANPRGEPNPLQLGSRPLPTKREDTDGIAPLVIMSVFLQKLSTSRVYATRWSFVASPCKRFAPERPPAQTYLPPVSHGARAVAISTIIVLYYNSDVLEDAIKALGIYKSHDAVGPTWRGPAVAVEEKIIKHASYDILQCAA